MTVSLLRKSFAPFLATFQHASRQVIEENTNLTSAQAHVEAVERAQAILQALAKGIQEEAHQRIAAVVTRCLRMVFDDPYEFRIIFERKRGKTEARLTFYREGKEFNPSWEMEGGVIDVASFALRLSCLLLLKPNVRRLLVVDEPFKFVNGKRQQRQVAEMLEVLSREMSVQIIMVTDDDWLKIGKVIEL